MIWIKLSCLNWVESILYLKCNNNYQVWWNREGCPKAPSLKGTIWSKNGKRKQKSPFVKQKVRDKTTIIKVMKELFIIF